MGWDPDQSTSRPTTTIDPEAPGFFEDPYPFYAELRDRAPLHQHPAGSWMVFRHAHVNRAWRDDDLSIREIHAQGTDRNQLLTSVIGDGYLHRPTMSRSDAPDHTRYRRVLARSFTPRNVERLRDYVDQTVAGLFADARHSGPEIDLIGQVARPLAYRVTAEAAGAPHDDNEELLMRSSHAATVALMEPFPTREQLLEAVPATKLLADVAADVIAWKRGHETDDSISALLAAERDGTLSDAEVITLTSMLFTAGHQTTYSAIGLAVLALLRHRSQWELLCNDPSLVADAVDECLRYDNTIQLGWRTTPRQYEIAGVVIPAGAHLIVWNGSANRDPDHWGSSADRLDVRREGAQAHLSFGAGPHLCLGAWLARIEIQSVVAHLVRHHGDVELANEPQWRRLISLRGPERLDLRLP